MEEWHRNESSGPREELIEQEQDQQEHEDTNSNLSDEDLFSDDQNIPRSIAEPHIELTVDKDPTVLKEIVGEDEILLSIIKDNDLLLSEIQGTDENYPISSLLDDTGGELDSILPPF